MRRLMVTCGALAVITCAIATVGYDRAHGELLRARRAEYAAGGSCKWRTPFSLDQVAEGDRAAEETRENLHRLIELALGCWPLAGITVAFSATEIRSGSSRSWRVALAGLDLAMGAALVVLVAVGAPAAALNVCP